MTGKPRERLRFFFRRIFRRTFVLGIYRRVRELVMVPYVHRILERASAERGAGFTVLQIGANDGVSLDPLSSLVRKHGWSGVLVEPNPVNFEKLQQTYANQPQVRLERAAITTHDGTVTLYRPRDLPDGSKSPLHGSDTLDLDVTAKLAWVSKDWQSMMEPVEVPAMRLATLHPPAGRLPMPAGTLVTLLPAPEPVATQEAAQESPADLRAEADLAGATVTDDPR